MIDTNLEVHPEIYNTFKFYIASNDDVGNFGPGDTPTVEQIVRAAIYKEIKGYDYLELEYAKAIHGSVLHLLSLMSAHLFVFRHFKNSFQE